MTAVVALFSSPKSPTESAVGIIVGIASLAVAFLNQHFFWQKGWLSGDKPAPRWLGRLLFAVFGLLCIMVGIRNLWL